LLVGLTKPLKKFANHAMSGMPADVDADQ